MLPKHLFESLNNSIGDFHNEAPRRTTDQDTDLAGIVDIRTYSVVKLSCGPVVAVLT